MQTNEGVTTMKLRVRAVIRFIALYSLTFTIVAIRMSSACDEAKSYSCGLDAKVQYIFGNAWTLLFLGLLSLFVATLIVIFIEKLKQE